MWIHEYQDWSKFTWDAETLVSKLADIRHRQGRLLGRIGALHEIIRNNKRKFLG